MEQPHDKRTDFGKASRNFYKDNSKKSIIDCHSLTTFFTLYDPGSCPIWKESSALELSNLILLIAVMLPIRLDETLVLS